MIGSEHIREAGSIGKTDGRISKCTVEAGLQVSLQVYKASPITTPSPWPGGAIAHFKEPFTT